MFWRRLEPGAAGCTGLRWRLAAGFTAGVLLVTALMTGVAIHGEATVSLAAAQSQTLAAVQGVAAAFATAVSGHADPARVACEQGLAANGRVLWLGPDGVVRVDGFGDGGLAGSPLVLPPDLADVGVPRAGIYASGGHWVAYAVAPLTINGQPAGRVVLVRDLSALQSELTGLQRRLWLLGGLLALIFTGAGIVFADTLARPLERLTLAVQRMRSGELGQSVPVAGGREIAGLAAAFNDMATRVAALDEQRRDFIADAAHELRTPLASLRALAEVMHQGAGPADSDGKPTVWPAWWTDC